MIIPPPSPVALRLDAFLAELAGRVTTLEPAAAPHFAVETVRPSKGRNPK